MSWELGGTSLRYEGRGCTQESICAVRFGGIQQRPRPVVPQGRATHDSFNVIDALLGKPGAKGRDFLIQQNNGGTSFGLRMGEWKLVRQKRPHKTRAVVTKRSFATPAQPNSLYHLSDDPGETRDVSAEHPEVFNRMVALLDKLIADGRSTPGRPRPHE